MTTTPTTTPTPAQLLARFQAGEHIHVGQSNRWNGPTGPFLDGWTMQNVYVLAARRQVAYDEHRQRYVLAAAAAPPAMPEKYVLSLADAVTGCGSSMTVCLERQAYQGCAVFYSANLYMLGDELTDQYVGLSITAFPVREDEEGDEFRQDAADGYERWYQQLIDLESVGAFATIAIAGVPHVVYVTPHEG